MVYHGWSWIPDLNPTQHLWDVLGILTQNQRSNSLMLSGTNSHCYAPQYDPQKSGGYYNSKGGQNWNANYQKACVSILLAI